MSKTLKTEGSEWASSELKTSRSEDQVPKTLKTEVLMNVSSIPGLEALKIKTRSMLTLIEASCKFKLIRSQEESTSVLQEVHRAERPYKAVTSTCKKHCEKQPSVG